MNIIAAWVLVLTMNGAQAGTVPGFQTEKQCYGAGLKWVERMDATMFPSSGAQFSCIEVPAP